MAAGPWLFTDTSRKYLLDGTFDLDTDNFNIALFTNTSDLADTEDIIGNVTGEHAGANGYTQGGIALGPLELSGTTTITVDDSADAVWTASGGPITAKFACIYENDGSSTPRTSSVTAKILCYCLLESGGADVTATDGNTLTVAFNASGIFTLSGA